MFKYYPTNVFRSRDLEVTVRSPLKPRIDVSGGGGGGMITKYIYGTSTRTCTMCTWGYGDEYLLVYDITRPCGQRCAFETNPASICKASGPLGAGSSHLLGPYGLCATQCRRGFIVGSQEELDNGRLRLVARKPGMGDFQSLK